MQNGNNPSQMSILPKLLQTALPGELLHELQKIGNIPIEEIRLHADRFCTLSMGERNIRTGYLPDERQLRKILLNLCGGSLYAHSQTINQGFLSPGEGIRVGVCGNAATEDGKVIVRFENPFAMQMMEQGDARDRLRAAISAVLRREVGDRMLLMEVAGTKEAHSVIDEIIEAADGNE